MLDPDETPRWEGVKIPLRDEGGRTVFHRPVASFPRFLPGSEELPLTEIIAITQRRLMQNSAQYSRGGTLFSRKHHHNLISALEGMTSTSVRVRLA